MPLLRLEIKPSNTLPDVDWFNCYDGDRLVAQTCKPSDHEGREEIRTRCRAIYPDQPIRFKVEHYDGEERHTH